MWPLLFAVLMRVYSILSFVLFQEHLKNLICPSEACSMKSSLLLVNHFLQQVIGYQVPNSFPRSSSWIIWWQRTPNPRWPILLNLVLFVAFTFQIYKFFLIVGMQLLLKVSILNGIVMGGGAGVSIHGRFRVATENSVCNTALFLVIKVKLLQFSVNHWWW